MLEADVIKKGEMKEKVKKEYYRRIKKILKSKLNGRNIIKAIKTWAISVPRYSGPFLDWNKVELREMVETPEKS